MLRVLVVDDSAVVRQMLAASLAQESDIELILAVDPYDARDKVLRFAPDVITLDIEMPRMDGLSFLARLMRHYPVPVVILSSLTPKNSDAALRALELGAVAVMTKPATPAAIPELAAELIRTIRGAAEADVSRFARAPAESPQPVTVAPYTSGSRDAVIVIGASTGGPVAIEQVLTAFPADAPGVLIVQHMPAGFTAAFARRLDACCALSVREAADGDRVLPGTALVAPGGSHLLLMRSARGLHASVRNGPPVHFQRPAVDVLFHSAALAAGETVIAALLTGMGADGASGMRALRDAGAHTIAQDEATSVVFSMPREAIRLDAASEILPLPRIGAAVMAAAAAPLAVTPVGARSAR